MPPVKPGLFEIDNQQRIKKPEVHISINSINSGMNATYHLERHVFKRFKKHIAPSGPVFALFCNYAFSRF